jgi:hypothetical protein
MNGGGGGRIIQQRISRTRLYVLHFSSSNWRTEDKKRDEDVSKERDEKGEDDKIIRED